MILVTCLEWLWQDQKDFFIGANLTIYFSRQQLRNRDFLPTPEEAATQLRQQAEQLRALGIEPK